jgi:tellurite resistance protein/uncharacterized protein (DUF697 family)
MTPQDAHATLAIAMLAALADGQQDDAERAHIADTARNLGLADADHLLQQVASGQLTLASIAAEFTTPEARQAAYDTAAAVCHANGWINPSEGAFLRELATLLPANPAAAEQAVVEVNQVAGDHTHATQPAPSALDDHILDQAIITAALELLPDGLANLGILPLQLRLVHHIGQSHGQQLDGAQVKDLAAVLGIGAAAQILEKAVRRTVGSVGGGLLGTLFGGLGGLAGGAAALASGAAVTFAATYALGHAADRYYRQDRQLSTADLRALFAQFRTDAEALYPRIEARVRDRARTGSLANVLRTVRP